MKPSEFIREAMEYVSLGWTQGTLRDLDGSVCMLGGLCEVSQMKDVENEAQLFNTAFKILHKTVKELGFTTVPQMNDHPDTTQQDVLIAMEKAAIKLEELGE